MNNKTRNVLVVLLILLAIGVIVGTTEGIKAAINKKNKNKSKKNKKNKKNKKKQMVVAGAATETLPAQPVVTAPAQPMQ